MVEPAQIIILNGAPRAGKSSIVKEIQDNFDAPWISLGVDVSILAMTPERYRPGIGLRPGGERPDLEPLITKLYAALYESIAAHSRMGINVVAEFGHHDNYSRPLGILPDCAKRLEGLPVLFVGVRCPIEEIMRRRNAGQEGRDTSYEISSSDEPVPPPVQLFQDEVHRPGIYDMEVDTSVMSPKECADAIAVWLSERNAGTAFMRLISS